MAKRPKSKRKGAKRGPKEERLIIGDPEAALDTLLRKTRVPLTTVFGYDNKKPPKKRAK
jgi:hypothetical protein